MEAEICPKFSQQTLKTSLYELCSVLDKAGNGHNQTFKENQLGKTATLVETKTNMVHTCSKKK